MATNTLFMQSEVVRPKLQRWLESFKVASNLIDKGEVQQVGERDYRIPVELTPGGRYGTYDKNFGDMNRGSSLGGNVLISTFFSTRINFELSMLKIAATAKKEIAVKSAFKDAIGKGMPEFAIYEDMSFHTDGTAVAGTATAVTTVSGQTVYTLDANMGIQRMRRGMYLTVYNAAFTVILAANLFIVSIDYPNKKITMSGTVPGAGATDVLCFDGVTGTTGSAPTWKKGLYYFNSSATSGFLLGIDRATEPETIANNVNVAGVVGPLDGLKLLDNMGQRRGLLPEDLQGLANTSQRAQIYTEQVANSEWLLTPGSKVAPSDQLPDARKGKFPFAGITHNLDYRQDRSRIDWISPSTWGKAQLAPMDYFEIGGQRFFQISGASGAPAAGLWFSLTLDQDFYCVDPGSNGFLYGLTIPSGY